MSLECLDLFVQISNLLLKLGVLLVVGLLKLSDLKSQTLDFLTLLLRQGLVTTKRFFLLLLLIHQIDGDLELLLILKIDFIKLILLFNL